MSDHAIPQAGTETETETDAGDERAQVRGAAAPQPAPLPPSCTPPTSPPPDVGGDPGEVAPAVGSADCLHTLLETAVTCRSVDEVADLVTLLRQSGQVPDAADQALRAAAVSRPIKDVISLAVLLARDDEPQRHGSSESQPELQPPSERMFQPQAPFASQPPCAAETEPGRGHGAEPERRVPSRGFLQRADRSSRGAPGTGASGSLTDRGLRWPIAVALVLSALLYLPRDLSRFLVHGGLVAWLLLGLAGAGLALGVLVTVRDRTWVWSATVVTAVGLVSIHALASVTELNLFGGAGGALLPLPSSASMIAACLAAVLSAMALLYRSDRPRPAPGRPLAPPEAVPDRLDARFVEPMATPTRELAYEAEVTGP
ncbi:hypothetical protein [Streptomyces sp. G-G2]|uniref:hypothetical protein n=1 Tax=Streptomyces sp. G-G2 TaxID=3046201 RepID=UPI0024BBE927|nr:hypothetical protein [Streptomyces sp. G-G2]MDJ0385306.1 hypothetical protein [Streptomyces sp. G-G2]